MIECAENKREQTISQNIGLVHACAHRFKGRGIEYDDLFQAGCMGLCKAADAFDETRGVRFSTYAVPVILGEMRRLFRDGGSVKVSRSLKEFSLKVIKEKEHLSKALDRDPTLSELSAALGEPPDHIAEALSVSLPALSLTQPDEDGGGQLDLATDPPEEAISDRLALRELLKRLDEKDRQLLTLRYFKNLTQAKTAALLSMTQVQVSRREKKLLTLLRSQLLE